MEFINSAISAIAALAAAVIAYFAYRFQVQTQEQEWYKNFNTLYAEFWNDPDMATVRSWIITSEGYSKIEPVIKNRLETQEVSTSDYKILEKIDKFCSLLIRISDITPKIADSKHRAMLRGLYFDYWIHKIQEREYLKRYVDNYWYVMFEIDSKRQRKS